MKTDTPAVATFLGYALNDAWVEEAPDKNHYRISLASQSKEYVEDFADALRRMGFDGTGDSPEPKIHYNDTKDVWQANLASKELVDWLKGLNRLAIGEIVHKWPREYLRSAYDANGSVAETRPGRLSLRYGMGERWLVELFMELLQSVRGYQVAFWRSNDVYYCAVNNQDQVMDFLDWVKPIYKVPKKD